MHLLHSHTDRRTALLLQLPYAFKLSNAQTDWGGGSCSSGRARVKMACERGYMHATPFQKQVGARVLFGKTFYQSESLVRTLIKLINLEGYTTSI